MLFLAIAFKSADIGVRPVNGADRFAREFDARLGGRVSKLVDASAGAEALVADAVRATFGLTSDQLSDAEAIERVRATATGSTR